MRRALGHGASTGSYRDWLDADLIVFLGSNVANNQPVTTKYLVEAKERGAQIAVVNPYARARSRPILGTLGREERALRHSTLRPLVRGRHRGRPRVLQRRAQGAARDPGRNRPRRRRSFDRRLRGGRGGGARLRLGRAGTAERSRARAYGVVRAAARRSAECDPRLVDGPHAARARRRHGAGAAQSGSARGLLGRARRGLTPIRGHSGVQGGAEVGCVPVSDPETLDRWAEVWGFEPPRSAGLAAIGQIEAAANGEIDLFWIVGGNFLDTRARSRAQPPGTGAATAARAPGRRAHAADARRAFGNRRAAARRDALRDTGRRHRDHDRATHRLLTRDPGPPYRRRAPRMGSAVRGDGTRVPGRGREDPLRGYRRHPPRDRARDPALRRHRASREEGRPVPVGRADALRRRTVCDREWARTLRAGAAPVARRRGATASYCSRRGAASNSTRWCKAESIRSPARRAITCCSPRRTRGGWASSMAAR